MSANIIAEQISWRSQGVECIEMANQEEVKHTINSLRGIDLKGRRLVRNEARPHTKKRTFKPHYPYTDSDDTLTQSFHPKHFSPMLIGTLLRALIL